MSLRSVLIVYFFATFLEAGTYGLTFLLPPLLEGFGGNEKDVGIVLIFTAVSTLITVLYMGVFTARLGRLNTIGLASVLIAISLFIFGQAMRLSPMLFVAGILLGSGWGLFYVLTPIVLSEITPPQHRIRAFTLLSVFIMAGFGLSPVFGYLLVSAGLHIGFTFTLTAVFCLISGVMFMALKGSIARLSHGQASPISSGLSLKVLCAVFCSRAIRPIIMVGLGASVFAGVTNFQTVYAAENGLEYATYFLTYTLTVILCRVIFAEFMGGRAPYATISFLLAIMTASVIGFLFFTETRISYIIGAMLFGIGYGVSYPIVKAMAANDAEPEYLEQTLQIFGLSYFIGVFGFPFVAGWVITNFGIASLLIIAICLAAIECLMALQRYIMESPT